MKRKYVGVSLILNEKNYEVLREGGVINVPMGGLISEYIRMPWAKLKNIILGVPHRDVHLLPGNFTGQKVNDTIEYLFKEIPECFSEIQTNILTSEILHGFEELRHSEYDEDLSWIKEFYNNCINDEYYQKYIPVDALIEPDKAHRVVDLLTEVYYVMLKYYFLIGMLLDSVTKTYEKYGTYNPKDVDTSKNDYIYGFFEEDMCAQDIDYKIAMIEGEFTPIYTLKSAMSVLLFDFAHVCKNNIAFVRCKNCGKFFVPSGRTDAVYCSFPLSDDNAKTCKDVGAINTRAEKEKSDVATKEYRKVYMRLNMKLKRHPDSEIYKTQMKKLTTDVKRMRSKLESGEITETEFVEWLSGF